MSSIMVLESHEGGCIETGKHIKMSYFKVWKGVKMAKKESRRGEENGESQLRIFGEAHLFVHITHIAICSSGYQEGSKDDTKDAGCGYADNGALGTGGPCRSCR